MTGCQLSRLSRGCKLTKDSNERKSHLFRHKNTVRLHPTLLFQDPHPHTPYRHFTYSRTFTGVTCESAAHVTQGFTYSFAKLRPEARTRASLPAIEWGQAMPPGSPPVPSNSIRGSSSGILHTFSNDATNKCVNAQACSGLGPLDR